MALTPAGAPVAAPPEGPEVEGKEAVGRSSISRSTPSGVSKAVTVKGVWLAEAGSMRVELLAEAAAGAAGLIWGLTQGVVDVVRPQLVV